MSKTRNKFEFVKQRYNKDCAIACIATITQIKYEDVIRYFNIDFNKTGINSRQVGTFIAEQGFDVIQKTNRYSTAVRNQSKRMLVPFAPIHYLNAKQFVHSKENHAMVMLKNGKVYDPNTNKFIDVMENFYEVLEVMGFWKNK